MSLVLTREELQDLTGYRQQARQLEWLSDRLRIKAPRRADGMPIVSRAQVEDALAGKAQAAGAGGPRWSKIAA
jgi:hypothetical protein